MNITTLEEAKRNKNWSPFGLSDTFNPKNYLEGYLYNTHGGEYGNLIIERVNGKKNIQYIVGTPKLHYPFDNAGRWIFPPSNKILRYRKYDGTNITLYSYTDGKSEFLTYKLRIQPFLRNSKWGPFLDMWQELLKRYPGIPNLHRTLKFTISFEMWGARNLHLIKYSEDLECSLLFLRSNDGFIMPPLIPIQGMPVAELKGEITADWVHNYKKAQQEIDNRLQKVGEEHFSGDEGEVWYCQLKNNPSSWVPLKCKPAQIEQIHWAQNTLNKFVIKATALNAFESSEDPSVEDVIRLLKEEFEDEVIFRMNDVIE